MIGQKVSHYRIVGRLGAGGMGVVYDAEDLLLPRAAALKFLPDDLARDPDATRRLKREARAIALLNHPNICTIYEIGDHEGRTFIAMERLEGTTLTVDLTRRRRPTSELVAIALQIAAALESVHTKGIVHRDIKPSNVFIDGQHRVKVLDFGLARQLPTLPPEQADSALFSSTIPGRPIGTLNYMAPERILQLGLDPRSDLFSLGVVMYELATGTQPFAHASPVETVTNILEVTPVVPSVLSPDRPRGFDRIVAKLLAKNPDDRYESAAALQKDLQALQTLLRPGALNRLFGR
jgi:serine/threonine protein kinase